MVLVKIINEVSDIFEEHGYKIYAVGGTVRDFLLEREIHDYDFVTDATPPCAKFVFASSNEVLHIRHILPLLALATFKA